jgi:hypothetical protein
VPPRAYWGIARARIRRFTLADRHDGFARVLRALSVLCELSCGSLVELLSGVIQVTSLRAGAAGLGRARDWRQKAAVRPDRFLRLGGVRDYARHLQ